MRNIKAIHAEMPKNASAFERGVLSVTSIRCVEHRAVPTYNTFEGAGECPECYVQQLRAIIRKLEINLATAVEAMELIDRFGAWSAVTAPPMSEKAREELMRRVEVVRSALREVLRPE